MALQNKCEEIIRFEHVFDNNNMQMEYNDKSHKVFAISFKLSRLFGLKSIALCKNFNDS